MTTKYCKACDCDHPITEFGRNRATADGLNFYCRKAHAKKTREWKRNNWESTRASIYRYREKKRAAQCPN